MEMNQLYDMKPEISELKEKKYKHALKIIDNALINWGYSGCTDNSFTYFVDGVLQTVKDWEEDE